MTLFHRLQSSLRNNRPAWLCGLLIIFTWTIIAFANLPVHSWLSGWDNLHPEFNFALNIKRAFTAVWQENQGLGHLGGHGYAATLLHSIFTWLLSLVIPVFSIRSAFTLIMLLTGALGTFSLSLFLFKKSKHTYLLALGTSSFYIFNLATIQNFYVQLEAFIIFYGVLPWTLLSFFNYLAKPSRTNLSLFFLMSVLLTPIGFIPPLFVVYCLMLGSFLIPYVLTSFTISKLRHSLTITLLTIIAHSYWLLPVIFYTFTSSHIYLNSFNNQLSTQDFNLQSSAYGYWQDVALLKGFMLESLDTPVDSSQPTFFIFQTWIDYLSSPIIEAIGLIIFLTVIIGSALSLRQRKNYVYLGWFIFFIIGMIALAQNTPPFSWLTPVIKNIPVINQAFRASFTKFSVPVSLTYAVLFTFTLNLLLSYSKKISKTFGIYLVTIGLILLPIILTFPIFQGKLFYQRLVVSIPDSYFELFDFFKSQPKQSRVAMFPLPWNWGWFIYDWGYSGSGFLWYGIEQPIVERTFDVWSENNETYYLQVKQAIDQQDAELFAKLLRNYQINWLVMDHSLTYPGVSQKEVVNQKLESLLSVTRGVKAVATFDKLTVYQVDNPANYLQTSSSEPTEVGVLPQYLLHNPAIDLSPYISNAATSSNLEYPFSFLLTNRSLPSVSYQPEQLQITSQLSVSGKTQITLPPLKSDKSYNFQVTATKKQDQLEVVLHPQLPAVEIGHQIIHRPEVIVSTLSLENSDSSQLIIAIGDTIFKTTLPNSDEVQLGVATIKANQSFNIAVYDQNNIAKNVDLTTNLQQESVKICGASDFSRPVVKKDNIERGFTLSAQYSYACLSHRLGKLAINTPQLLSIAFSYASSDEGKSDVCLTKENDKSYHCYNPKSNQPRESTAEWQSTSEDIALNQSGTYWIDVIGQSFGDKKIQTSYRDLQIKIQNPLSFTEINQAHWEELLQPYKENVVVESQDEIRISTLIPKQNIFISQLSEPLTTNCDIFKRGNVNTQKNDGYEFTAQNGGVNCVISSFNESSSLSDYLLHIKGEHLSGRGLKFYIDQNSDPKQSREILLPAQNFDAFYSLIPNTASTLKDTGLMINIENRSFPHLTTKNKLQELSLISVPIDWISDIKLGNSNQTPQEFSTLTINQTNKVGTFYYQSSTNAEKPGYVVLNQGYDPAWIALIISKGSFVLPKHFSFNGWANAWEVPAGQNRLIIIYWPQLLSFLGYGLLIGTTVFFIRRLLVDRKKQQPSHFYQLKHHTRQYLSGEKK